MKKIIFEMNNVGKCYMLASIFHQSANLIVKSLKFDALSEILVHSQVPLQAST